MVVAGTGRIHEVVSSIPLDDKGSFEEIRCFGIGDEAGFGETFQVGRQFSGTAAKAFVYPPGTPVHVYRTVIIYKSLSVQSDGICYKTIRNEDYFAFSQNVLPRSARGFPYTAMDDAGLAIEIVILAIGVLHHVGSPYPVAVGPVHGHQGPVYEVFAGPYLCRAKACTATVGRGIHIVGVAKLLYSRVGKVSGDDGITCARGIEGVLRENGEYSQ